MNRETPSDREALDPVLGLALPADLERSLRALAEAAGSREACGLLLGLREESRTRVTEVVEVANLAGAVGRFRLDPVGHLLAERRAEERGLLVLGVWHGHPGGDPRPSRRDLRGTPPGWCQLILACGAAGGGRSAAWLRTDAGFRAIPLIRSEAARTPVKGLRSAEARSDD